MIYLINRLNTNNCLDLYVTGSQAVASRLQRGEKAIFVPNVSMADFVAYFNIKEPEVKFERTQYSDTIKCPEQNKVSSYLEKALAMSKLDEFDPRKARWEEEKSENLAELEKRRKSK